MSNNFKDILCFFGLMLFSLISIGLKGEYSAVLYNGQREVLQCLSGQFCWDFESGIIPVNAISYRDEYEGELIVDSSKAYSGKYSLHAKALSGGKDGENGGPKKSIVIKLESNFGPLLWGRMFLFVSPQAPISHAGFFNARYESVSQPKESEFNALNWYEVASYQKNYMAIWHPPEPPGFPEWVKLASRPLDIGKWVCVEWVFDATPNETGIALDPAIWVESSRVNWQREFVYAEPATQTRPHQHSASNFTFIELGVVMYQGLEIETDWWMDDVVISAARVGCK